MSTGTGLGTGMLRNTALGGDDYDTDGEVERLQWDSGEDYRVAGGKNSESWKVSGGSKDTG